MSLPSEGSTQQACAEWTSAAWHKQTKCNCLITCSRPFAGLAGLMGKKMHCFQPRQKLGCHACLGACALHYNASSGCMDGAGGLLPGLGIMQAMESS